MEKWMIVYVLPLEVWMDIFVYPWISRKDFGQIVDRIGNFKFAEHAQFYLHEWGKHILGELHFNRKNGMFKCLYSNDELRILHLDVPQTALPEKIDFCDSIHIHHVDANIIHFLGLIQPLLTDKEIRLFASPDYLGNLRTIWTHLAPLLGNIRALLCSDSTLPLVRQQFGAELATKFGKLKFMHFADNGAVDEAEMHENVYTIMDWLSQPENEDNVPRLCECESRCRQQDKIGFFHQLYLAIRQQFLAAQTPCTFAVNLINCYGTPRFEFAADFHLENGIGEVMRGVWTAIDSYYEGFQITRHRANLDTDTVQAWIDEVTKLTRYRYIEINYPTIGPIDAAAQIDAPPLDGGRDDQQPSTSKDA